MPEIIGWVTLTGTPGVGVPAGTLVTAANGRIVVLAQPALIGPTGDVSVPVTASRPEDIRAFQAAHGLPADGIAGPQTRARVTRVRHPTRYSLIMADEDWWA